jgi:hypothetical protein
MSRTSKTPGDDQSAASGVEVPAPPPANGEKRRVKCAALKGKKVIVGKGEVVQIDDDGFFEVQAEEAERLLTIPGYEPA